LLTIECEEPKTETCDCCGGKTTRLTRFVYRDGFAFAIYYATFSNNHPDRLVKMVVALGNWSEEGGPGDRRAFALDVRSAANQYEVGVTDASACPWKDSAVLGRVLDRQEALAHPWVKDVFHITDHAVLEDKVLKEHLDAA
jgi:hypothetical protein